MPCTRETPCGAILYEDSQSRELALAGIPRRVQKCLAGHSFWEGELPTDAIPTIDDVEAPADELDDEDLDRYVEPVASRTAAAPSATQRAAGRAAAPRKKTRARDRRVGPPRVRRASTTSVTVDGFSLEEIQRLLDDIRAAISTDVLDAHQAATADA